MFKFKVLTSVPVGLVIGSINPIDGAVIHVHIRKAHSHIQWCEWPTAILNKMGGEMRVSIRVIIWYLPFTWVKH